MGVVILNFLEGTGESCSSEINSSHINIRNNSFCQGVDGIVGKEIDLCCCHREIGIEGISVGSVALLRSYTCIMSISFLSTFKNPPVLVTLLSLNFMIL